MATVRQFEDLQCWQLAREVAREVYALTRQGAMARDFGLCNQIRRASGSVMDNIAEGFERGSRGEFVQFLAYAKGSAGEVKSQLYRALDQTYITPDIFDNLTDKLDHICRIIKSLQNYLNSSAIKGNRYQVATEPASTYCTTPMEEDFVELINLF